MKSKRARDAESAIESEKPVDVPMADEPSSKKRKRDNDDGEVKDKSKKDKKDKKDKKKKHQGESRKEKKDKRKDLQDLPDQDEPEEEEEQAEVVKDDKASKKEKKKEKKEKKDKKNKDKEQSAPAVETNGETDEKKKEKKDKKTKKDKKNKDEADESTTATATATATTPNGTSNGEGIDLDESSSKKNDRHIVFVGNLPYSATAASISAHFASLSPIAVRCLTKKGEKDPNVTCKGIAFVEFANVWTQRTCLDKFHHSMFDDKKSAARRINVELTAGGGGKNANRHEKIAEKNRKLDENRAKRIDREKTTKAESAAATHLDDAIHPSRRGRVPGSGY